MVNTIVVCGLGAIGSNALTQLSKMYPDINYIGIDFDKVERRNIGTQAYFNESVGSLKAVAMSMILKRFNTASRYSGHNKKIEKKEDVLGLISDPKTTLVLDCFDNVDSRKLLKGLKGVEVFHMGFSTKYTSELMWDSDYIISGDNDPDDADICTMVDAAAFIHFVVNFGVMQLSEFFQSGKKRNHIITNKWGIKEL